MNATVYQVITTPGVTLIIFHDETRCWQFQAIIGGLIFVDDAMHFTRESAEEAARDWLSRIRYTH